MKRLFALILGVAVSASAYADFTAVGTSGETNFNTILNSIYGPGFAGASFGGSSYTNGSVTVTRVHDFFSGDPFNTGAAMALALPPGVGASDQLWQDGVVTRFSARARFAGYTQQFGYYNGHSGAIGTSTFNAIGGNVDQGLQNTLLGSNIDFTGQNWRWGRRNFDQTNYNSSLADDNADNRDHLISYYVTGTGITSPRWLLFWDDQLAPGQDGDYNDLVVELVVVPAPGAALLGVLGLSIAGWVKRRMA